MTASTKNMDVTSAQAAIKAAAEAGKLSSGAVENINIWLTEPRYSQYRDQVLQHVADGLWQKLDDAFWTIIPFGTGGRRGRMYPIGSNAINDRTIGESAQGLAEYVVQTKGANAKLSCAIAYDTRHNSRHFAELCASIMVANGFKVYFLDDYRATPQLSFAVRFKGCDCGIMVTASHNPPSDNAVKVYWSTGGQVLPPHDKAIIQRVMDAAEIKTTPFKSALAEGKVEICTREVDEAYLGEVLKFAWNGPRDIKVLYSPLHGVGSFAVLPVLANAGFENVAVFGPHSQPSPDFPNVPGHVSNPENSAVFDAIVEQAKQDGSEICLATDPDADRMGCSCPMTLDLAGPWATLNGNQLGALLTDFVLLHQRAAGRLNDSSYVIKTLVTTELTRRIAEYYKIRCEGNLHVGFKWIAGTMDAVGPDDFQFGTEESHGYLIGQYVRDKDAPVACLLMCLMAAYWKAQGKSLHQRLDELFQIHGYHLESLVNVQMEGSEGMAAMQRLMSAFRTSPPTTLGGLGVIGVRDYESLTKTPVGSTPQKLDAPKGNMVVLDMSESGNYVAVRPSGTEPKVKFYMFSCLSPEKSQDLSAARKGLEQRLNDLEADVRSFAKKYA